MTEELDIIIEANGDIAFVYDDRLAEVFRGEPLHTVRASHCEPRGNEWTADMSPVNGPVLGPFQTRQAALDAEREWIREHLGL